LLGKPSRMRSSLVQHPASTLVAIVVAVLLVRLLLRVLRREPRDVSRARTSEGWALYTTCFFSGVLFTNALAHFSHGISGEQFPAPFGFALGTGFLQHLSNVLWGFLNIVLGYNLFVHGRVSEGDWPRRTAFFAGILVMGVFLAYVFSRR
jgi:hypothetical protein